MTERLQAAALRIGVAINCGGDVEGYMQHTTLSITGKFCLNFRYLFNYICGPSVITGLLDDNNSTWSCLTKESSI